jgi:hypothetical protein
MICFGPDGKSPRLRVLLTHPFPAFCFLGGNHDSGGNLTSEALRLTISQQHCQILLGFCLGDQIEKRLNFQVFNLVCAHDVLSHPEA